MFCELTSILLMKLNNDIFSSEWTNIHIFINFKLLFLPQRYFWSLWHPNLTCARIELMTSYSIFLKLLKVEYNYVLLCFSECKMTSRGEQLWEPIFHISNWQYFSIKWWVINVLDSVGQMVCVVTIQRPCYVIYKQMSLLCFSMSSSTGTGVLI